MGINGVLRPGVDDEIGYDMRKKTRGLENDDGAVGADIFPAHLILILHSSVYFNCRLAFKYGCVSQSTIFTC